MKPSLEKMTFGAMTEVLEGRGVEIAKFYTCPGTSKWPECTCQMTILLVPNN